MRTREWLSFVVVALCAFLIGTAAGPNGDFARPVLSEKQAHISYTTPSDSVRPIPASVPSFVGPVPVVVKPNLMWRQQPVYGLFLENQRRIELRAGTAPRFLCAVLIHERVHLALHDAGVFISDDDLEDRIADAIMQHFALGVC